MRDNSVHIVSKKDSTLDVRIKGCKTGYSSSTDSIRTTGFGVTKEAAVLDMINRVEEDLKKIKDAATLYFKQ